MFVILAVVVSMVVCMYFMFVFIQFSHVYCVCMGFVV